MHEHHSQGRVDKPVNPEIQKGAKILETSFFHTPVKVPWTGNFQFPEVQQVQYSEKKQNLAQRMDPSFFHQRLVMLEFEL